MIETFLRFTAEVSFPESPANSAVASAVNWSKVRQWGKNWRPPP